MDGAEALAKFDICTEVYKVYNGHQIKVDIMLPKGIADGKHAVIIDWHGGGLIFGARDFPLFFQPWLQPLAEQSSTIIIAPDYRLLPESSVADIIDDLEDFWTWLKKDLPGIMKKLFDGSHQLDFDRIALVGGSAGGFCCVHLGLAHPDDIKVLMVQYPFVQLISERSLQGNGGEATLGVPSMPKEEVLAALDRIKPGEVYTEGDMQRMRWGMSAIAWGYHSDWLGYDDHYNPTQRIRHGARLPPKLWILQGEADEQVRSDEARTFAAKVRKFCRGTEVRADFIEGKGHGFDTDIHAPYILSGVEWSKDGWLR